MLFNKPPDEVINSKIIMEVEKFIINSPHWYNDKPVWFANVTNNNNITVAGNKAYDVNDLMKFTFENRLYDIIIPKKQPISNESALVSKPEYSLS